MKKIILLFILTAVISFPQEIKERTEQTILDHYSFPVKIELIKFNIPESVKKKVEDSARQKFFGNDVYIYKIMKDNKLEAVAILDNVYGKSMPITFLVIIDTSGKIRSSEIIKYREPYGGAVQNKNWMDQFKGKDSASGYKVSEDINTISGATISVNSVTAGIRKTVLLFKEIKNQI